MTKFEFDKLCNHFIVSGYFFQGSEIYGGLSNTWDYGPLGSEIKQNIRKMWWKKFHLKEADYASYSFRIFP